MSDTLAKPELLRSLGRLARGLSALFWGLHAALLVCAETARAEWLKPLGIIPALGINALLFYFVGRLVDGFHVDNFWAAMWGALIVSITNLVLSRVLARAATPPPPPPPPSAPDSGSGRADDVIDI